MQLLLLILALLQHITRGFPGMLVGMYNNSNANFNVGPIRSRRNRTFVGGVSYVSVIDRPANITNVVNLPQPNNPICAGSPDCVNAMVLTEQWNSTTLFVCGTQARAPECYYVNTKDMSYTMIPRTTLLAENFVAHLPTTKNPSLLLQNDQGHALYSATCTSSRGCNILRQFQQPRFLSSSQSFNRPTFLAVYYNDGKVYTFFREYSTAFHSDGFTKDGQRNEYGFVARVCTDDQGGVNRYVNNWITFVKARLVCPFPGRPYEGSSNSYYDVLTSTYQVGEMIYAVFSLPSSQEMESSALCSYNIRDMDKYFDGTVFLDGVTLYYTPTRSVILSPYEHAVPYLPGQCYRDAMNKRDVPDEYENFISETTLLGDTIPPSHGLPPSRFTTKMFGHVAAFEVGNFHIICVFTNNGYMMKMRTGLDGSNPVTLFETQIQQLLGNIISVSTAEKHVLIVTKTQVFEISTIDCSLHSSCEACEADPHCNWQPEEKRFACVVDVSNNTSVDICHRTPNPVTNVNVTWIDRTLQVSWQGDTTSYFVTISRKKTGKEIYSQIIGANQFKVNASITNLKMGITYTLNVYAVNGTTLSSAFQVDVSSNLTSPSLTLKEVTSTTALLSWDKVTDAMSYNVTILNGDSIVNRVTIPHGSPTFFYVYMLNASSNYQASVIAISEDSIESDSSSKEFTTTVLTTMDPTSISTESVVLSTTTSTEGASTSTATKTYASTSVAGKYSSTASKATKDQTSASSVGASSPFNSKLPSQTSQITRRYDNQESTSSGIAHNAGGQAAKPRVNVAGSSDVSVALVFAVIFGGLVIVAVVVLVYNHRNIARSKKAQERADKESAGGNGATLERRYFFLWVHVKGEKPQGDNVEKLTTKLTPVSYHSLETLIDVQEEKNSNTESPVAGKQETNV